MKIQEDYLKVLASNKLILLIARQFGYEAFFRMGKCIVIHTSHPGKKISRGAEIEINEYIFFMSN